MNGSSKAALARSAPSDNARALLAVWGALLFSFRQWMRENLPTDGGMTVSRATVLLSLANKENRVGMGELGEGCGLSPRSMTVLVDGLEKEGLVERAAHETDRRITLIGITDAGRQFVATTLGPSDHATASVFDDLSADEQRELLRLFDKLQASLRARGVEVPQLARR